MQIKIPYAQTHLEADVAEANLQGIYTAELPPTDLSPEEIVARAVDKPIGSRPLPELAKDCRTAVIIASDHTRPVPSKVIMPVMLRELRRNNPEIKVTILIATGLHRDTTQDELIAKFGPEIVENENIVIHDSRDESQLVDIGELPSGGRLVVNKLIMECDLLLAEGFIEPHFFAGFSGGRKSVLPGVAGSKTVKYNHCAGFIANDRARTGILTGNPIHEDMLFAARQAKLAFIVNVILNAEKQVVYAVAGDTEKAHQTGCAYLADYCRISAPRADIVITSNGGYPLDQNLYQAVKGMTAGEALCKPNGVIILSAACNDGLGGEEFYRNVAGNTPEDLLAKVLQVPADETISDQWQYQILVRILSKFKVIVVTQHLDHKLLRDMHITPAGDLSEALSLAYEFTSPDASVAVIPDGVSVIVQALDQ